MKLISINNAEVNMILARNVYDNSGKVLLAEGAVLTDNFLERLEQFGINSFYIIDGITDKAQISGAGSVETTPAPPKPAKEELLYQEIEVDEALKDETMSDVVKMTNDHLDKLMGKMALPFLTTNMESFQYSNEPQQMTTDMPDDLTIPTDTPGMTTHMTTKSGSDATREHSNDENSGLAGAGWIQTDTPGTLQCIGNELHQLDNYYKTSQAIADPSRFMATNILDGLIAVFHDLEAFYTTGGTTENSKFEIPYLISNIMTELDKLKTSLPVNGPMNDSLQFDAPNSILNIYNQLNLLENSYMIAMKTDHNAVTNHRQEGNDVSSINQNIINGLNDLEKTASQAIGKISEAQDNLNLLTTTAKIREELGALQSSYNSYMSSARPLGDRTGLELLQPMNKLIQELNEQKYSLITLTHSVVDDQTKSKMMGMIENIALEIKQLETAYMISMHPLFHDQLKTPDMNLTSGISVTNPNPLGPRDVNMTTTAAASGLNPLNPRDTDMTTTTAISHPGQPNQHEINLPGMNMTTEMVKSNQDKSSQANNYLTTGAVKRTVDNETSKPTGYSSDVTKPEITNQGGFAQGTLGCLTQDTLGCFTENKPSQTPVDAFSKERIKNEALKLTYSLLDNLTGQVDVNQVANNLANLELNKITNSIMDHLNSKYNSDINIRNQVKTQAYQITHEAMAGIREGIARNDATRKVIYDILKDITSNERLVHLLVNLRASNLEAFNHSISVYVLTTMTGIGAGYSHELLKDLAVSALLHDIGKISVPGTLLNKGGELSDEEVEGLQKHTQYGYDMLSRYEGVTRIPAMVALQHHERIDGSGYPNGLKEHETHQFSRIVALADVYDSLLNDKTDGRRKLPYEIIEYIRDLSGRLFDYNFAKIFLQNIEPFPIGSMVLLNTGEKAIVFKISKDLPARPVVRVVIDKNGELLAQPFDRDLKKDLTFFVYQVLTA